jgi:hypothetical protein
MSLKHVTEYMRDLTAKMPHTKDGLVIDPAYAPDHEQRLAALGWLEWAATVNPSDWPDFVRVIASKKPSNVHVEPTPATQEAQVSKVVYRSQATAWEAPTAPERDRDDPGFSDEDDYRDWGQKTRDAMRSNNTAAPFKPAPQQRAMFGSAIVGGRITPTEPKPDEEWV